MFESSDVIDEKGHPRLGDTRIFFSLLLVLTKEARHTIDRINLRVHNHISINLGAFDVRVSHQSTNGIEVAICRQSENGKAMSARMKGDILGDSSHLTPFMDNAIALFHGSHIEDPIRCSSITTFRHPVGLLEC